MDKEIRNFTGSVEIRANEDGSESRTITGYGAVFNQWSHNLGGFKEQLDARAFDNVDFSDVVATFNHDFNNVVARTTNDSLTLNVDDTGLRYEFEAPNTTAGNDLLENVRSGLVTGSSFMFTVPKNGSEWRFNDEGADERTIKQIGSLIELGPVTKPAYPQATAAARDYEAAKAEHEESKKVSVLDTERKYKHLRSKI